MSSKIPAWWNTEEEADVKEVSMFPWKIVGLLALFGFLIPFVTAMVLS